MESTNPGAPKLRLVDNVPRGDCSPPEETDILVWDREQARLDRKQAELAAALWRIEKATDARQAA